MYKVSLVGVLLVCTLAAVSLGVCSLALQVCSSVLVLQVVLKRLKCLLMFRGVVSANCQVSLFSLLTMRQAAGGLL